MALEPSTCRSCSGAIVSSRTGGGRSEPHWAEQEMPQPDEPNACDLALHWPDFGEVGEGCPADHVPTPFPPDRETARSARSRRCSRGSVKPSVQPTFAATRRAGWTRQSQAQPGTNRSAQCRICIDCCAHVFSPIAQEPTFSSKGSSPTIQLRVIEQIRNADALWVSLECASRNIRSSTSRRSATGSRSISLGWRCQPSDPRSIPWNYKINGCW